MIAWFTRNDVAANLLMISLLLAGISTLFLGIPLEVFPTMEMQRVNVNVTLRGSTPEDVEKGVSIRIEEAVQDLEGIERISSVSSEGRSRVSIDIEPDYDARELLTDIKSRVDAINTFPAEAEKPIIGLLVRKREVMSVTVSSPYSEQETREMAEAVRDELLNIPGVTQLELSGVRNYEVAIEVSQDKLHQYNLSIDEVSRAVRASSVDVSAGNIKTEGGDVLIHAKGQAYRKDEFAAIAIKTANDGSIIRLEDVAVINDGFEETPVYTRFNGKQAIFIDVYRIGLQSAIDVADKVRNYIEQKQHTMPEGFEISYWDDDSQIVKNRISTLTTNALQGGILVLALLTLFLRPAIAFWVFIGIPVSFMGAFLVMPLFGVTINIMSLFGFILVLGIVVDDAIVTGENVYTHLKHTDDPVQAAINGTEEVALPVTFGILTTMVAFLPLAFIAGPRGAIFSQVAIVVMPILAFSLIESKFVLPAHLKYLKHRDNEGKPSRFSVLQQRFADGFENMIVRFYNPFLRLAIRNKLSTISLFVSMLFIIVALITSGWTKFTFWPRVPSETIRVNLSMPAGTPYELTNKLIMDMTAKAELLQEKYVDERSGKSMLMNILAITGGRGGVTNSGRIRIEMVPPERRTLEVDSRQVLAELRRMIGVIPGAESLTYRAEIGRSSDPIDVQLSGNSLVQLRQAAEEVKTYLATYPTVFEIADSLSNGKEEIKIRLNEQGKALGFSLTNVSSQVRQAFFGSQVQRIQRGRDDIRVMVRFPIEERRTIANLEGMLITAPSGVKVPLSSVAYLDVGQSPASIRRIDRYRTVSVTADLDKKATNMTVLQGELKTYLDELVQRYPGISHSLEGEAKEQRESMGSLGWSILFVLGVIYALLAIPFKSYVQPLLVMSVIPFGIIGALVGHWLLGLSLTMMSLLGLLALSGVVVNDSLVLVDYINKKRKEMPLMEAVLTAGTARFRPVILTSLTTFIGLLPLLFEQSTQAQFLIPMAVSMAFGIIFATFITLILVPVNYLLLERLREVLGWQSKEAQAFSGSKTAEANG